MKTILLLNQDYSPLNVTTLRRAFKLVFKGKAEVISHDEENPLKTDVKFYKRPTVIRLLNYIYFPYKKVLPNRKNIFKRDDNKCVYCGSNKDLTLDHLIPKSKGGNNTWKNLVTCCGKCNRLKDNMMVDDFLLKTGYKMSHQPYKPTHVQFIKKFTDEIIDDWLPFLK